MEVKKVSFPEEEYLKLLLQKKENGVKVECGTVVLSKGQILPFKTLDLHEIAYLISGKLKVSTKEEGSKIMNPGDIIYLNRNEIRKTETLEDSKILFFLFNNTKCSIK